MINFKTDKETVTIGESVLSPAVEEQRHATQIVATEPPAPSTKIQIGGEAKIDHGGSQTLPPGPWQDRLKGGAKAAVEAYLNALDGKTDGLTWREKVAQIFAQNDIAGTMAGTGAGDIVDRFHEGLNTSRSLIRSYDLDQELLARAEYGDARV